MTTFLLQCALTFTHQIALCRKLTTTTGASLRCGIISSPGTSFPSVARATSHTVR